MKARFIENSLVKVLNFFRDEIFSEEYARKNGLLQRLPARLKLIGLLSVLITIAFLKTLAPIFILYLFSLALACLSRINIFYFLLRVWVFIPLFSLFIAIPALFSAFSPGEVIFLGITKQGVANASLFVIRVLTSVSFCILVMLTTRHTVLLKSLRSLGVPLIFVATFMMCYRYIFIFVKITEEMYLGIKSRLINGFKDRKARKVVAWHLGVLWEKSRQMSEEVYLAMVSRGYSGEPK